MMKLANAILFITMGCTVVAMAQTAPASPTAETVELFRFVNIADPHEIFEIPNLLHPVLDNKTVVSTTQGQNALLIKGTAEQLLLAHKLLDDLDRPRKTYRLAFTITESDSGKRIGTQHFAMVLASGQRTTLKQGSKVPVATGSYTAGNSTAQTQFTYLDVGINLDASIDDSASGIRLKSRVEQSSILDSTAIADVREPIIRQNVLEGVSLLSLGKPVVLGGLDIPGSTRHLDIEAVVEVVK